MDPVSIFGIVTGVVGLLSTGAKGLAKWKEHRKEKKLKQLAEAEEALMEGHIVLKRDYDRHHGFFGSLFERGDSISLWSLKRTMNKFKRTMALFMEYQMYLTIFDAAIRAARTETSGAMSELHQRLRTSRSVPQSLNGRRYARAIEHSAEEDEDEDEDSDDNGDGDRLIVWHPEPQTSRASNETMASTSSSSTVKPYVRLRPTNPPPASAPSSRPLAPPVTYRNSINLQRDLELIGKDPTTSTRSSVSTTLATMTPQITITTLEIDLDSIDKDVITPVTVDTCPGSPRVLEENFKLLFGEQPTTGSATPTIPTTPATLGVVS